MEQPEIHIIYSQSEISGWRFFIPIQNEHDKMHRELVSNTCFHFNYSSAMKIELYRVFPVLCSFTTKKLLIFITFYIVDILVLVDKTDLHYFMAF